MRQNLVELLAVEQCKLAELEIQVAAQAGRVDGLRRALAMFDNQGGAAGMSVVTVKGPAAVPERQTQFSALADVDAPEEVTDVEPLHGFTHKPRRGRPPGSGGAGTGGTNKHGTSGMSREEKAEHRRRMLTNIATRLSGGAARQNDIAKYVELSEATVSTYLKEAEYFARNENGTWRLTDRGKTELLGAKEGGGRVDNLPNDHNGFPRSRIRAAGASDMGASPA
jgi:hypothetical protein